jgi:hypothetical protein
MLRITLDPADAVLRRSLQAGSRWFGQVGAALAEHPDDPIAFVVPSVIVPEYNVVLYPRAEDFEPELVRIESVEPFEFDARMFAELTAAFLR